MLLSSQIRLSLVYGIWRFLGVCGGVELAVCPVHYQWGEIREAGEMVLDYTLDVDLLHTL